MLHVHHCDGKMMDIAGIGSSSEVLAVLGSGPPAYTGGKLLGIQLIQNSTRIVQAQISFDLLKSWNLTQNITGLVFDINATVVYIKVLPIS